MRRIIATMVFLMFAPTAMAVDLTCTLPTAYVTRGVELCEELRLLLHVRTSEWDNSVCASQFLRFGMFEGDKKSTRRASELTVAQAVNDAADTFRADWPRLTPAFCGDGTLDTEFGEACDDGNDIDGDGCTQCDIDIP